MIPLSWEESSRTYTTRTRRAELNHEDKGHWADLLKRNKGESFMGFLLHNTGGIGFMNDKQSRETLKLDKNRRLCIEYKIDLSCLTEINKD